MKRFCRRTGAKLGAWLLLALLLLAGGCSLAAVALLAVEGTYLDGGRTLRDEVLASYAYEKSVGAFNAWNGYYGEYRDEYLFQRQFGEDVCNFGFTITNEAGEVLLQNFKVSDAQYTTTDIFRNGAGETWEETRRFATYDEMWAYLARLKQEVDVVEEYSEALLRYVAEVEWDGGGETGTFPTDEERARWVAEQILLHEEEGFGYGTYEEVDSLELRVVCRDYVTLTITGSIPTRLCAYDKLNVWLGLTDFIISWRYALIVLAAVSCVMTVLLIVFLFCGAGRRPNDDEVHLTWFDRIPLELLLGPVILIDILPFAIALDGAGDDLICMVGIVVFGLIAALLTLLLLLSWAVRVKAGHWWTYTLCFVGARYLLSGLRKLGGVCRYVGRSVPLIWQILLGWALLSVVELIFAAADALIVIWVLEKLLLTPVILLLSIHLVRLRRAAQEIAGGDLRAQVELRYMYGAVRSHGEDLNHITEGLQQAVEQQMRSERLKTELITNVSHDIKTPLTSIVNYVDLLSREEMPSDAAREYVAVLQRQSARLRKLTEDLVEASKAATGNMEAHPEPMDVNVLLSQTAGEYEEKLRAQKLEPIVTLDEAPAMIFADGQLLWRVFDNLLGNICKYALPGTRVYLAAHRIGATVEIVFRNISRYALNVSGAELMERFVRGDTSRSTEGSGLGLSIARSLTELQGGGFDLVVDGDLFKITMQFAAI